jgi:2-amino-4-hydroxy-6-hydroxymethyldihydropteridine diphosphokinase
VQLFVTKNLKGMLQVDILLGGNVGNTLEIFSKAKRQLVEKAGQIIQESSLYQTEAWGFDSEPFLNQVITIETTLLPEELLQKLFSIETYFGRERKGSGYSARTLDLDILFVKDQVINEPTLIIPHPRMAERRFVLEPLVELYPNRIHPVTGKTISQMLSECSDNSGVEKLL